MPGHVQPACPDQLLNEQRLTLRRGAQEPVVERWPIRSDRKRVQRSAAICGLADVLGGWFGSVCGRRVMVFVRFRGRVVAPTSFPSLPAAVVCATAVVVGVAADGRGLLTPTRARVPLDRI